MNQDLRISKRSLWLAGLLLLCGSAIAPAQHQAIGFKEGMPFSEGYIAGNTLYVAGQQGPDAQGKVTGTHITLQTTNTIAAVEAVVKKAGFQIQTSSPSRFTLQISTTSKR